MRTLRDADRGGPEVPACMQSPEVSACMNKIGVVGFGEGWVI